ncbi:Hypothetical_protein [Hexamita inflata]|uniref:Hypothetical_protein n=1 Tax=Hexamita inflata TaxID=28002 RepID=A0AA86PB75_9EUKA|nr:Hypothetical protein HINF_LOCUS23344 [Hexamita inflata]
MGDIHINTMYSIIYRFRDFIRSENNKQILNSHFNTQHLILEMIKRPVLLSQELSRYLVTEALQNIEKLKQDSELQIQLDWQLGQQIYVLTIFEQTLKNYDQQWEQSEFSEVILFYINFQYVNHSRIIILVSKLLIITAQQKQQFCS